MKKKDFQQILEEKTVSFEEAFKDFTPEQEKRVEEYVRYYDMLMSLRKTRKKLGLTQKALAKKAKIPRTTISKIESGYYNPTVRTLMNIASAMNKELQIQII